MAWWTNIWNTKASSWCHGWIGQDAGQALHAEQCYLTLTLRSIYLPYVRKGTSRFFGAVHSFTKLAHNAHGEAEFHAFTVPAGLKGVDASGLHNVVNARKTLFGPVPYRGGPLKLEIALFSIASQDLAEPFLSLLEGLSDTIGVAYIGAASGLLRQLSSGIDSVSKSADGASLELGLASDMFPVRTGDYVVVKDERTVETVALGSDGRIVDRSGESLTKPYFVFSVEASERRDDWRRIPALLEAYQRLEKPVAEGRLPDVQGLMTAFKRTVLLSSDLLDRDAARIVSEVEKRLNAIMGATFTARTQLVLPSLDEISID
jgi:hypothetical protein